MLYRQGDVLIQSVDSIPMQAIAQCHVVLAEGELSGHRHRVENEKAAQLFAHRRATYLRVLVPGARVVHDEHGAIELPLGDYVYWRQREYAPELKRWDRRAVDLDLYVVEEPVRYVLD